MKELKSLIKINLTNKLNIILGEEKRNKKKLNIIMLFVFFNALLEIWIVEGFKILYQSNNEVLILKFMINLEFVLITGFAFFKIIDTFYLASNWKDLIVYPIKIGNLLLSKVILCYISVVSVSACLTIPLISYGILAHISPTYYLKTILYQVIIPFIPVVYTSLISLTVLCIVLTIKKMTFKNKYHIKLIILNLVVIMLTYILIKPALNKHSKVSDLLFNMFFNGKDSFLVFPSVASILIKLIITLCIILVICGGLYIIGGNIYLTIMKSGIFISKDSKTLDIDINNFEFKKRGIIVSNIIRDAKLIIRTPILYSKCIIWNAGFSALFAIILILFNEKVAYIKDDINGIKSILLITCFLSLADINGTLITSFSREGRSLRQFKVFPWNNKKLFLSKFYIGILSNIFAFISTNIFIYIISSNFTEFILLQLVALIYMILIAIIQIGIDLSSIELKWISIKDLFDDGHYLKILPPYFILTLLPIVYLLAIRLFNINLTEYLSGSFMIFIGIIYSIPSLKTIKANLQ